MPWAQDPAVQMVLVPMPSPQCTYFDSQVPFAPVHGMDMELYYDQQACVPYEMEPEMMTESPRSPVPGPDEFTFMIRNIPNKFTAKMLLQVFNERGFEWTYDFFYLPVDFRNDCNVGYAFINFPMRADAEAFRENFDGFQLSPQNQPHKILRFDPARVQGLVANREHFRNSHVMSMDVSEHVKPMLFDCQARRPATFPPPDWEHGWHERRAGWEGFRGRQWEERFSKGGGRGWFRA
mmetsp:Transcript_49278/g.107511  ORF Transcript_49278/g.107511 Transcript_49278/m.107511 type:complete len:236 (-) Transcript_49278:469-1176(-)